MTPGLESLVAIKVAFYFSFYCGNAGILNKIQRVHQIHSMSRSGIVRF